MALTKEALLQLIALQERDAVVDQLQKALSAYPVQIQALKDALEAEKSRAAAAKARTVELEKKKKELELELASKEEAVRKHMMELNQVKTNEAFKALQNEIDRAKAAGGEIETGILEVMEQLDASRRQEKAVAAELKTREDAVRADIAAVEAKLKEAEGKAAAAKEERDRSAEGVDAEAMRAYGHIRARGKNDAVVRIEGNSCGACQLSLSPQKIVEATRATTMVLCESCQRILYIPAALAPKPAAAAPAPPAA